MSRLAKANPPRRSDGVSSIRLGILAVVVLVGRVLAVQWTGPMHRTDMLIVYSVVAGLSLRGAWFGLSGLRKGHGIALSAVGMMLNLLVFTGPSFILFHIVMSGH